MQCPACSPAPPQMRWAYGLGRGEGGGWSIARQPQGQHWIDIAIDPVDVYIAVAWTGSRAVEEVLSAVIRCDQRDASCRTRSRGASEMLRLTAGRACSSQALGDRPGSLLGRDRCTPACIPPLAHAERLFLFLNDLFLSASRTDRFVCTQ